MMKPKFETILTNKMDSASFKKIEALGNTRLNEIVATYTDLCEPDSVIVCDDSQEDIDFIRNRAIELNEEIPLATDGHTIHFDGYHDQARDKENTCFFEDEEYQFGDHINSIGREEGLEEIFDILAGIMHGHEMYVRFYCLGPLDSPFSISAVQLTDSPYVTHSEDILYRHGYEQFKKLGDSGDFFHAVHSEGELVNNVSKNIDKRRIYIDFKENRIFSSNTQYAGNTVGLKKLCMRLAIKKSAKEGWLTEHMFVMGAHGPGDRTTYLAGAFPSACGKTSTSMLQGETIVGDDIAYLRVMDGSVHGVNVEKGIFGIIRDVNAKNDPLLFEVLNSPGETIFSNVLKDNDNNPYWLNKGEEIPSEGINHSGKWYPGKTDEDGREITVSHKNARYTIALERLDNQDPKAEDPAGVPIKGIIYGGRDSDTSVPVEEAFSWAHGILTKGATLESETTAATLGKEGVRKFCPMSILDFLGYPIGEYLQNNLNFGESSEDPPLIFSVNYFLKNENNNYLNDIQDKRVWIKWIEKRIHGEVEVIDTPTGRIPKFADLAELFNDVLQKDYTEEEYNEQFQIRVQENLEKIERMVNIYSDIPSTPDLMFDMLDEQKERLEILRDKSGDYVVPMEL